VEHVQDIFAIVDRNADGVVSLQEFKAAFEDPEVADTLDDVDTEEFNFIPPPVTNPKRRLRIMEMLKKQQREEAEFLEPSAAGPKPSTGGEGPAGSPPPPPISEKRLEKLQVKLKAHDKFREVWSSKHTGSRGTASVWLPTDLQGKMFQKKNSLRLCLGYYVNSGFTSPAGKAGASGEPLIVQVADPQNSVLTSSGLLRQVIDECCPVPVRYRLVWARAQGKHSFYAWLPVAPSDRIVAIGMVATTTPDPPTTDLVRCVPKTWVTPSAVAPQQVWNDSGTSGRLGSFWIVNRMQLMTVIPSHEAPTETYYDLIHDSFTLDRDYNPTAAPS